VKLGDVANIIGGTIVSAKDSTEKVINSAFASDLMSDVLTVDSEGLLLITGLANMQTIRTAEMADIAGIVFVRNKRPSQEMIRLADENQIVLIESSLSMFNVSGKLFEAGIKPLF
jgi:predicted transcriptional regulator